MSPLILTDYARIEVQLRRNPGLHLYELGDLDDFFRPWTTWFTLEGVEPAPLVLFYTAPEVPVLVALGEPPLDSLRELLAALVPQLPPRVYAHLSGDLISVLAGAYDFVPHGRHLRLLLTDPGRLAGIDTTEVVPLGPADAAAVGEFYARAYPGNWFDPRMLETGRYFGLRRNSALVAAAGVHVYSRRMRIAALGNVATLPELRGQGLATKVCAQLVRVLQRECDVIGLNVKDDNAVAIACYRRLGFSESAELFEYALESSRQETVGSRQ